jgi:L-2-hydroxyglutarate oxidase LhgO
MTQEVGAVVVGAGVVGLAIARRLALAGHEVIVLDRNGQFGMETSSRNSEVIHAGIYYPAGSLKARLCVEGRDLLYRYCEDNRVPYRRCGKIIFAATPDQHGALEAISQAALASGVEDVRWIEPAEVAVLEPDLPRSAALHSPSTGIIDSHGYMMTLLGEAEAHGAMFVGHTHVERIVRREGRWQIHVEGEADAVVSASILINAAGLGAQALAATIEDLAADHIPALHLARGVYFSCTKRLPFTHLIYPIPTPGGLGTHLTFDLAGQCRFGPDVEWIDTVDYTVDPGRHASFLRAARAIWPGLEASDLAPGYAGVRPKLSAPGAPAADFVISTPNDHGLPGLVNLFGIESPGLTSSPAIAERVAVAVAG